MSVHTRIFLSSAGMKLKNPFSLQSLSWLEQKVVVCAMSSGLLLGVWSLLEAISAIKRLNFKSQPKTGHVCTALGALFKEHLWVSHLTCLCLSSPCITKENNINASLTFIRYCEAQCTTRGDVLGYYSNRGHRS